MDANYPYNKRSDSPGMIRQLFAFLIGVLLLVGVAIFGYFYFFTNQLPLGGPDLSHWKIRLNVNEISDDQSRWTITYHTGNEAQFQGLVRHATPFRTGGFDLITHDILLTTGDFADAKLVSTQVDVFRHRFSWQALTSRSPSGSIHLMHTVPANPDIYRLLLKVRSGDQILITGKEIDKITAYNLQSGRDSGYWQDDGCDSIVVTGVTWLPVSLK